MSHSQVTAEKCRVWYLHFSTLKRLKRPKISSLFSFVFKFSIQYDFSLCVCLSLQCCSSGSWLCVIILTQLPPEYPHLPKNPFHFTPQKTCASSAGGSLHIWIIQTCKVGTCKLAYLGMCVVQHFVLKGLHSNIIFNISYLEMSLMSRSLSWNHDTEQQVRHLHPCPSDFTLHS